MEEAFKSHLLEFNTLFEQSKTEPIVALAAAYDFAKTIVPSYYDNNDWNDYGTLLDILRKIEQRAFEGDNLLDLSLPFDPYTGPDVEETLPYIVWSGRTQLMLENRIGLSGVRCLSDLPIDGHCFSASKYIKRLCDHVGIACQRVEFFPGFSHKDDISWNYQCHDFNIVCIDSTLYLVDITFAQFFHKCDNLPDRLGILGLEGPSVGYYMMRLEGGETLAGELCINGYAKFDDVFKTYMDAFVLATRNGCYYEKNGILLPREGILPDSLSLYDQATYMRFLFTPDSLVNYEDRDGLGKQRKLLMDPNYQFFS